MTDDATDQIRGVAEVLAATDPSAWRTLLAQHTADSTGHCSGCRYPTTAPPVFPCRLRAIGEEAERLSLAPTRNLR